MTEETKHYWLKLGIIALVTFLVSYIAFYVTLKHHFNKIYSPCSQIERMEKMMEKQAYDFDNFMLKKMENPFEPKIRPMMVNLVKELNEYKIIIDLSQIENNEEAIDVSLENNELTVKGQVDKNIHGKEKIIRFAQTYYLDEKVDDKNITKERKGNKYIITMPFNK